MLWHLAHESNSVRRFERRLGAQPRRSGHSSGGYVMSRPLERDVSEGPRLLRRGAEKEQAEAWVEAKRRTLPEGRVGSVIRGSRVMATGRGLTLNSRREHAAAHPPTGRPPPGRTMSAARSEPTYGR